MSAAGAGAGHRSRLLPDRQQGTDLLFTFALGAAALVGLRGTYAGAQFLLVGLIGLLLGMAVAHVSASLRQPLVLLALLTIVTFFLLGGAVALHGDGLRSSLPLPATLVALVEQVTQGWKDLLTTLPPVDRDGPLLVLPYFLGVTAGAITTAWARRDAASGMVVATPVALLAVVILLGSQRATGVLLQGAVFTVLALWWVSLRSSRRHLARAGGRQRVVRIVSAAAVLAVATGVALPVATQGVVADKPRVVLRTFVEPPFDVGRYPSPLASFRRYVPQPRAQAERDLTDKVIVATDGLPDGTRLRFATLDRYDGIVWGAANVAAAASTADATFRRVGSTIPQDRPGRRVRATVTLGQYAGVWLPTAGALTHLEFRGAGAEDRAESFRYNIATSTGVAPGGLGPGDSYRFEAVVPDDSLPRRAESSGEEVTSSAASEVLRDQADAWSGEGAEPLERVRALADHLRTTGFFSHGATAAEQQYHAGHFVTRLQGFAGEQIVGDDEQYAAAFALMANSLGAPTRVVMGGVVEDGRVRGRDVHAWVETKIADGTWRTIPTEQFMRREKPRTTPPQEPETTNGLDIPPPAPVQPPSVLSDPSASDLTALRNNDDDREGRPSWVLKVLAWVVPPIGLVALVVGTILGLKESRRRRRRARGAPWDRAVGAWAEVLDHARDRRWSIPAEATRREQALRLPPVAAGMARDLDRLVFGPVTASDAEVTEVWAQSAAVRSAMDEGLGRRSRWGAALSLRSLRPRHGARRGPSLRRRAVLLARRPLLQVRSAR